MTVPRSRDIISWLLWTALMGIVTLLMIQMRDRIQCQTALAAGCGITELVRDTENDLLYHHSRRVYFFGALSGEAKALKYDPELLYAAAMFHDMGLTPAHSSKDISYVELHYADGPIVRDETIASPDYAIDGGAGDEIDFATVKSGTTTETFDCVLQNSRPTAILEVETPVCFTWPDGLVDCDGRTARTTWSHSATDLGYGEIRFFCGWPDDQSCVEHVMPCEQVDFYSACRVTYTFRGYEHHVQTTSPPGRTIWVNAQGEPRV